MSHDYHGDLKGVVLRDGCEECEDRASRLDGLASLDDHDLWTLANMAHLERLGTPLTLSNADHRAIDNLRLMGRIVFRSGITEEVCR